MVKRGRPSLNLTPEERVQRRRLQLVASQRKRRAHKRLAQLPKAATETPDSLPVRPDEEALCQFYDAMFLGQPEGNGDAANAARKTPSPDPHHAPLTVCHNCGSAPLDMASLTAMSSHSPASLLRTSQLRTDTYAPSSRLAGPMPSSTWAEYPSATGPGKPGVDQDLFTEAHLLRACSSMPLFDSILDSLLPPGIGLDGNSLLGELESAAGSDQLDSAQTPAKEPDNVFLPGRFSRSQSEWMPTNANETPYGYEKAISSRRPPSPSPNETGSTLSDDGVDPLAPWAGTKQAIPMGL
ncbi:hypothetical protein V8C42DRAFT_100392 [Trichoderma barbatum]